MRLTVTGIYYIYPKCNCFESNYKSQMLLPNSLDNLSNLYVHKFYSLILRVTSCMKYFVFASSA